MHSAGQSTPTAPSGSQSYTATIPNTATFTAAPNSCSYFARAGSLNFSSGAISPNPIVGGLNWPWAEMHRTDWHPSASPCFRGLDGNAA